MLSTLVIVALQDSQKVLVFFWPTDCVSLDFFRGVGRDWPFLSFWPIIFSFSPGRWFEILLSLVPSGGVFYFFFLVPWMLVDIRLVYIYIYIYIVHLSPCNFLPSFLKNFLSLIWKFLFYLDYLTLSWCLLSLPSFANTFWYLIFSSCIKWPGKGWYAVKQNNQLYCQTCLLCYILGLFISLYPVYFFFFTTFSCHRSFFMCSSSIIFFQVSFYSSGFIIRFLFHHWLILLRY